MTRKLFYGLRMGVAAALVLAFWPGPATAQEVQWRHDYSAARREAAGKNRPLVVYFGTQGCFWCRKLEASTFRDPGAVGLMNQHFIPLKLDADREASLTQYLRIQSYPTVVLAAPDGKILAFLEGYTDAPGFRRHLQRPLAHHDSR